MVSSVIIPLIDRFLSENTRKKKKCSDIFNPRIREILEKILNICLMKIMINEFSKKSGLKSKQEGRRGIKHI